MPAALAIALVISRRSRAQAVAATVDRGQSALI
jgi:hypothetical protein